MFSKICEYVARDSMDRTDRDLLIRLDIVIILTLGAYGLIFYYVGG